MKTCEICGEQAEAGARQCHRCSNWFDESTWAGPPGFEEHVGKMLDDLVIRGGFDESAWASSETATTSSTVTASLSPATLDVRAETLYEFVPGQCYICGNQYTAKGLPTHMRTHS